ncbi:MAG: hypothetical protein JWO36_2627 [Myxococcales bacterium]|nr:hypothetical protein [Myxococcales bacterium]
MPVKRLALAIALVLLARPAFAKGAKADQDEEADSSDADDEESDDTPKPKAKGKAKAKPSSDEDDSEPKKTKAKASSDDESDGETKKAASDDEPKKQDLTGHDLGTNKKANEFEKDRFFVDKVDTEKTEDATLIQGSLTASSFLYTESGGAYGIANTGENIGPSRMFGDLRLQTDFRHIKASRWEARVDGRVRLVNSPNNALNTQVNHVQAGLTGQNEYDIRELWLVRNGVRSDVFLGRQYIPDLGGLKIDGLRVDYASSAKFTLLGFGGLYPLRGSRSLTNDYDTKVKTVAGGFGAAYRTINAYGSIGGVALIPLNQELARVYGTSSGYLRSGPKLDIYHFALIDFVGSQGFQITNLSGGINYKPSPRLRLTANFNRVDTESLQVQANTFLNSPDTNGPGGTVIQNEAYLIRLATNEARAGVSAGLGPVQRFELSTAVTFRYRPAFTLTSPPVMGAPPTTVVSLNSAQSVELWVGLTDRHSIKDSRIGLDFTQTSGLGTVAFQRTNSFGLRGYVAHDIKDGRGEVEVEVAYVKLSDSTAGMACVGGDVANCFGASSGTILSLGGQFYYRINSNWFGLGSLYISQIANNSTNGMTVVTDPAVLGITGFGRLAYRF